MCISCARAPNQYTVAKVVANKSQHTSLPAILSSSAKARSWIPRNSPFTFKAPKGTGQLAVGLIITRDVDNERLAVMLGCSDALGVGVDAVELPFYHDHDRSHAGDETEPDFQELQQRFAPTLPEEDVPGLKYHRVSIDVDTTISNGSKYLLIDLNVDMTAESIRAKSVLEATKMAIQMVSETRMPDPLVEDRLAKVAFWKTKK
jgi:hypothetical protein